MIPTTFRAARLASLLFALAAPSIAQPASSASKLVFPNSGAPGAQERFLYGLAQLHNFEYQTAAEAFQAAQKLDPGFALAYWGEAMTFNHAIWMEQDLAGARAVLARLGANPQERAAKAPTEREKGYLAAVETLYGEGTKEERDFRYEAAMGDLSRHFPDDPDAAAFHALSILGTAHAGRDTAIYMRSAAILEEWICRLPDHPGILHYLIHSYDDPVHAPLGLRAARRYGDVAPEAPHARHMTSHIFLALGDWDGVVAANEAASAAGNRMRGAHGQHARGCGHYPFWLAYGYLEQGRPGDARRVLEECRAEATSEHALGENDPGYDPDRSSLGSYVAMWTRYLIDSEDFGGEIAGWMIDPGPRPATRLGLAFARGFAAARRGDLVAAKAELAKLEAARAELDAKLAIDKPTDRSPQQRTEVLALELAGAIAVAEGKSSVAVERLLAATKIEGEMPVDFGPPTVDKPAYELLGEILLASGDASGAKVAFETALARTPRRTTSLLGLSRAATRLGDEPTAARAREELREIWQHADRIPAEVSAARSN
ncbi:MAG TPA: hypothetical protein VGS22_21125 [Thermoanaerobaculia bacterium]|jgi:tetratricopeptide (TPR) repeat protein|nr:hypothetical protein [Thermoanaerobaculia bacterium]